MFSTFSLVSGGRRVSSGVLAIIFGVGFFFASVGEWRDSGKLQSEGVITEARVVKKGKIYEGKGATSSYVDVSFADEKRRRHVVAIRLPRDVADAYVPSDKLTIRYLPDSPQTVHVEGQPWPSATFLLLGTLILIVFGGWLIWTGLQTVAADG